MNKDIIVLSPAVQVSMADEWYDIASADHFWMQWRFNALLPWIKRLTSELKVSDRFLEIGCGHGQFIKQAEAHTAFVIDGCDLNRMALEMVNDTKGDIYVYDINLLELSMVGRYRGIFLLDVIEHIDDDQRFLTNALKHVAPGGLVFINVPALQSLFSKYDVAAGHKRRYTAGGLRRLLERCGVQPVHVGYWGLSLIPIVIIRKLYLNFIPKEKIISEGFAPPSKFINSLFKLLMKIELSLFSKAPLGTSVMAVGRKL